MQCPRCGTELIAGKAFCHVCGERVAATCRQCGALLRSGFRFCPDCGVEVEEEGAWGGGEAAVAPEGAGRPEPRRTGSDRLARLSRHMPERLAEKIHLSKGAIEGERKLVTVLFCDLAGSTAIAEGLDPEEYRDLLDQYLELAIRKIYRFEGIVNQLAGDGLMALFGAPIAHEDEPQRAIRAALAIQDALEAFNREGQARGNSALHARIGIHTGPVVVGTVGNDLKMDYTATGDTTNLASRLEALATPGRVLVSETTHRLVRGLFEVKEVGPLELKGKREPVVAYEVIGPAESTSWIGVEADRGLTPFVGRDAELMQLRACYDRLASNLPQVVAVVGEAGMGKSRLVYELQQQVGEENAVYFEGRCAALSRRVPYSPWVGMLRQYFGLAPGDSPECACGKLAEKLSGWEGRPERAVPLLCRLLSLGGADLGRLPAGESKLETFEAVAELVGWESRRAPVIIIVGDLHWIDEPSREMLENAVMRLTRAPVMLLVTHRPDYETSWRSSAAVTQLKLRPLAEEDATAIMRALAGGPLPRELERLILDRAEGSPYYVEEITRALMEDGSLACDDGEVRLTRPVDEIRVPDTIHELIEARLDHLGGGAKRVVQVAAVVGRQFRGDQIARLLDGENVDVTAELERLARMGVIHRKSLLAGDEFRFGESLTQEIAYETLLIKERRQWHDRIASMIEKGEEEAGPARSAVLAHHFARSENVEKAVRALLDAAREAERLPSYYAAADFYCDAWKLAEAALDGSKDGPGSLLRSALEAAVGAMRMTVMYSASQPIDGDRVAPRGRELAEALGDTEALAALYALQGMLLMGGAHDRFAEGLAMTERGVAMARDAGFHQTALSLVRGLAFGYLFDGRFDPARESIATVVQALAPPGDEVPSDIYFGALFMRDKIRFYSDDLDAAFQGAAEAHALARRHGNRTVAGGSAATLAELCYVRGAYPEAKRWADEGLEISQAIENAASVRSSAAVAAAARIALGEAVAAARYVDMITQNLGTSGDLSLGSYRVVEALLLLGDVKRAEQAATQMCEVGGGRLRRLLSGVAMGDVLRCSEPVRRDEAARWYREAIELGRTLNARAVLTIALLGCAALSVDAGDTASAVPLARDAVSEARSLGLGHYERRAQCLLDAAADR